MLVLAIIIRLAAAIGSGVRLSTRMTADTLFGLALVAGLVLSQAAHAVNDDTFVGLPRYVRGPKVVYPDTMRQQGVEGRVVVRVLIGADGKASEARIHRTSGWVDLDNAALRAVRSAQWETVAEPIWCLVPIIFTLR